LRLELIEAPIGLIEELEVWFPEQTILDHGNNLSPILVVGRCNHEFSKTFGGAK
jgi:hypothetical protein